MKKLGTARKQGGVDSDGSALTLLNKLQQTTEINECSSAASQNERATSNQG
jgi:hypothetical protein